MILSNISAAIFLSSLKLNGAEMGRISISTMKVTIKNLA
jgi:hypothetical protein